MNEDSFSKRRGVAPTDVPITIRDDAPGWLRERVLSAATAAGISWRSLRQMLCERLLEAPDPNNWSDPNIASEVRSLLGQAHWYSVYDFAEDCARCLLERGTPEAFESFAKAMNDAFVAKGVGWQLVDGRIEARGTEVTEQAIRNAVVLAQSSKKPTASQELHEALLDLSKRPLADVTGAVQHAMAALECVARDIAGDRELTLGQVLKQHPDIVPAPLDQALIKVWGYASNHGRHLREDQPPDASEAELMVGLSAALITYLLRKLPVQPSPAE